MAVGRVTGRVENTLTSPFVSMRPIWLASCVNHSAPSGPAVMPCVVWESERRSASANSEIEAKSVVIRAIADGDAPFSANQSAPSGPVAMLVGSSNGVGRLHSSISGWSDATTGLRLMSPVTVTPPAAAEMVTVSGLVTALVCSRKVPFVLAAGTSMVVGTVTNGLLLASAIDGPVAAAGAFRVTVATAVPAPTKVLGHTVTATGTAVRMVSVAWTLPLPGGEAVIVRVVRAATGLVAMGKTTEELLAGMATVLGTVATVVSLLVRGTMRPPAGAGVPRVTWPVTVWPPVTLEGNSMRAFGGGGITTRMACLVMPLALAEIVTDVAAVTAPTDMVKVVVVFPAGTVTEPGTVTTAGLLPVASVTANPPVGAAPLSTTVPTDSPGPITFAGFTLSPLSAAGGTQTSAAGTASVARRWSVPLTVMKWSTDVGDARLEWKLMAALLATVVEPTALPLETLISRTSAKLGLDWVTRAATSPQGLNSQKPVASMDSLWTVPPVARLTRFQSKDVWPVT